MRQVRLVAGAVFRESVRDRVPYSMVLFAVGLIATSFLISQLTAGQDLKIIKDLGLAALSLFGMLIAIFLGIGLVSKEVERKSIFGLLAKPITRGQLVIGKYAGLVATLVINLAVMTLAFYALLAYMSYSMPHVAEPPALDPRMLIAIVLIVAEVSVITAIALFFSTFSSPLLSAVLTLGLWVAGHFNADLRSFGDVVDSPIVAAFARGLYYTLPNLAPFDVKGEVVYGMPIAPRHVILTLLYAIVYVGMLLTASVAIFRRRDFK